ncbi:MULTISPECIES: zf-TFIIB domain-containing protein [unclassified Caulobacter]|jgi:Zn-finger nucleic acid-binding protein|uniref:TFIIB-type zinc ribbon-containing protein n=1 Tax=unclassified Caulobacter TaxID=2648921 RepID=UPI000783C863|nr:MULTISPECIES: zf-TFIIB domain-containing protein [unclassified Caulobacter]AZS21764.1 recombination protein RecR [Caulobacter sp. FWC26]
MTDTMSAARHEGGLLCPVCRVDLVMTDRQGIEIDYCPKCRGVWLDRGELDKIIERSMAYEAAPPPQPAPTPRQQAPEYGGPWEGEYRGDHDRGGHGGKHGGGKHGGGHGGGHGRRRGFLGGLFD